MVKSLVQLSGAFALMTLEFASPALAGPPLICHPFETSGGSLLSWGAGSGWNTPDRSYDVRKLAADVTRLLAADSPTLTRMENLRRATIYAMSDATVAHDLLKAVMARATRPQSDGQAWFDAGYLIESYRQAVDLRDRAAARSAWTAVDDALRTDGYGFVKKALAMAGAADAEMEFAASLMTQGAVASAHRTRAAAAAGRGSALAQNLARIQ